MKTSVINRDQTVLLELVELERKSLEVSEDNSRLFSDLLEASRSHIRDNLLLFMIALNLACSMITLFIKVF